MNTIVTDRDGNPAPHANWGNTDLSGINLKKFHDIDVSETVTRSGFTGPRYVRLGEDSIGDVKTGGFVPRRSVRLPDRGHQTVPLHLSAHHG